MLNIHSKIERSSVNGPGNRSVIWVQGCSLKCPGCQNPKTHKFGHGENALCYDLVEWVVNSGSEGLTLSGGEPMEQFEDGVDALVYGVHKAGLSVGMFTGYTEEELNSGRYRGCSDPKFRLSLVGRAEAWRWLKTKLDWAVLGRYNQNEPSDRPMLSSRNQKLVLFSDRYKLEDFQPQKTELIILGQGGAVITGFPGGACAQ